MDQPITGDFDTLRPRVVSLCWLAAVLVTPAFGQDVGPLVGHVDATSAHLLVRRGEEARRFTLYVADEGGRSLAPIEAIASADGDFVAKFAVEGLRPETRYRYRIASVEGEAETPVTDRAGCSFTTASADRVQGEVTVCFASCIDIEDNPMWNDVRAVAPDMLALIGDTPYIDSTDLEIARERHREFLGMPGLAELTRSTPTVGTWDDHDFGRNNANGGSLRDGRARTRQAFVEYRAHRRFGTGQEGVFHNVDLGLVEVFLLDPRYFSQTEPSPVDPRQPTCFGQQQWDWLLKGLRASEAPFKVLAMGMIWQDKKNGETDDMFTYWYERDALFDTVKREGISGVVLVGGDIHVSRHLVHPQRVGYDLHDFVVSPGHARTITGLDVDHPSLRWSLVEGHQFLSLTASGGSDGPELTARFRQSGGRVNRVVELSLRELTSRPSHGLERDRRALWSFEEGLRSTGSLTEGLSARASHPDMLVAEPERGRVVRFDKSREQFLTVGENPLDDNSDEHTFALWFRPASLPSHGSEDRMFLLESTAEGEPSALGAWHLSLGLRACDDPEKVDLQLYSYTLGPAAQLGAAPLAHSQGGFDLLVERAELEEWTHVACVFDSISWSVYLNGELRAVHRLPMPGPASEFGGLVVGGHRTGRGRNFDGWIDDVALWSRALGADEIVQLARPVTKR